METLGSITSSGRAIAVAAFSAIFLTGCGAGGSGTAPASNHLLATTTAAAAPAVAAGSIRVHFHRAAGDTSRWGVYSWDGPAVVNTEWIGGRFMMTHSDDFGGYVDIPVNLTRPAMSFLVTGGSGTKNCESESKRWL